MESVRFERTFSIELLSQPYGDTTNSYLVCRSIDEVRWAPKKMMDPFR